MMHRDRDVFEVCLLLRCVFVLNKRAAQLFFCQRMFWGFFGGGGEVVAAVHIFL